MEFLEKFSFNYREVMVLKPVVKVEILLCSLQKMYCGVFYYLGCILNIRTTSPITISVRVPIVFLGLGLTVL
jgi:hypothetical protein